MSKLQKVQEALEFYKNGFRTELTENDWTMYDEVSATGQLVEDCGEKAKEALAELKEFREGGGWKDFNWRDDKEVRKLKGKYLCETMNGNIWVAELNKDKTGYPHKCSCGMNAAMSMHFTKYRPLPESPSSNQRD
jgi:hypothetical protein